MDPKLIVFAEAYLRTFNRAEAYQETHPRAKRNTCWTNGSALLRNTEVQAYISERLEEVHMSADEVLKRLAVIGRSEIGVFFKVTDEWMFNPPPTSEILDQKEVTDDTGEKPVKRISYRVRRVIIDLDKVMDPQYSHLIKEFSDHGRKGMSIKLHDAKSAQELIGKHHRLFAERVEVDHTLRIEGLEKSLEKIYGSRNNKSG